MNLPEEALIMWKGDFMKKIGKSAELLWIFGILFVAIGVALCSKANLGVSMIAAPTFVIHEAIAPLWDGFSVGVTEYLVQGVVLILLCLAVRRFNWRYLLAFAVAVIYGYTLNLFLFIFDGIPTDAVWIRFLMLIVGDIFTALGVACFFHTYLPLQVHELFVAEFSARYHLSINKVKWAYDLFLLTLSVVLALTLFGDASTFDFSRLLTEDYHSVGIGTIITTVINSPLIALWGKGIEKLFDPTPRFEALERLLVRKQA